MRFLSDTAIFPELIGHVKITILTLIIIIAITYHFMRISIVRGKWPLSQTASVKQTSILCTITHWKEMYLNDIDFSSSSEDSDYDEDVVDKLSFSHRSRLRRTPGSPSASESAYDPTGRDTYTKACKLLKITPARHFMRNLTQTEIDLGHRSLGPVGVRAIAIALLKNTCITRINLEDNGIGDEGVRCVSTIFEQNYFITELNMANNNFSIKGAEHIAKFLAVCNTLKKLDVSGRHFISATILA